VKRLAQLPGSGELPFQLARLLLELDAAAVNILEDRVELATHHRPIDPIAGCSGFVIGRQADLLFERRLRVAVESIDQGRNARLRRADVRASQPGAQDVGQTHFQVFLADLNTAPSQCVWEMKGCRSSGQMPISG
jgi:hypothetical protein